MNDAQEAIDSAGELVELAKGVIEELLDGVTINASIFGYVVPFQIRLVLREESDEDS